MKKILKIQKKKKAHQKMNHLIFRENYHHLNLMTVFQKIEKIQNIK